MASRKVLKMIDIGANLTDPMFQGIYNGTKKHACDFDSLLLRSRQSGIDKMIITAGTLKDSREALTIASSSDYLYTTVGVHPTRCKEFTEHSKGPDDYMSQLISIANSNPKVVAIGEMGLDYDRLHFCPRETQLRYFEAQLKSMSHLKKPLFLHNRNSTNDFVDILTRLRDEYRGVGGVVHSFDGSVGDMNKIVELGFHIGINGCSLKTESNLETAKQVPIDKLMIETDCPYCEMRPSHASYKHIKTHFKKTKQPEDPSSLVKGRNEPSTMIQVLEVLAAIRHEDIHDLCEQIYDNTQKLFFQ